MSTNRQVVQAFRVELARVHFTSTSRLRRLEARARRRAGDQLGVGFARLAARRTELLARREQLPPLDGQP